jgi:hypothetical protein
MYNNLLDALFISSLLSYYTSTCFGLISSHHQVVECVCMANGTCYTSELTVSGPGLAWTAYYYSYNSKCTINPTQNVTLYNQLASTIFGFNHNYV